jgi:hypothetical protein
MPKTTALVYADPEAIMEVLANFLSNARGFSPAGGKTTVAARETPERVEVSITDEGIGIEPERCHGCLPSSFEPTPGCVPVSAWAWRSTRDRRAPRRQDHRSIGGRREGLEFRVHSRQGLARPGICRRPDRGGARRVCRAAQDGAHRGGTDLGQGRRRRKRRTHPRHHHAARDPARHHAPGHARGGLPDQAGYPAGRVHPRGGPDVPELDPAEISTLQTAGRLGSAPRPR